jgi:dihydroorotase
LLVLAAAAQQPQYDLLLKGGRVIDPKNHLNAARDVAISDGRIARVAEAVPAGRSSPNSATA